MRAVLVRLSVATAVLALAAACSSHWSASRELDPVDVSLLPGEPVLLEASLRIERSSADDDLPCAKLGGTVTVEWIGPEGVPVEVAFFDAHGVELEGTTVEGGVTSEEEPLGTVWGPFARDGADRCSLVLTTTVTAEEATEGALRVVAWAADSGPAADDEPENATFSVDLVVER